MNIVCVKCFSAYDGPEGEHLRYCPECWEMFSDLKRETGTKLCCMNDSKTGHFARCDRKAVEEEPSDSQDHDS